MDNCKFCNGDLKNFRGSYYDYCFNCNVHFYKGDYVGNIIGHSNNFYYIKTIDFNNVGVISIYEAYYDANGYKFTWTCLQEFKNVTNKQLSSEKEKSEFLFKFFKNIEFA